MKSQISISFVLPVRQGLVVVTLGGCCVPLVDVLRDRHSQTPDYAGSSSTRPGPVLSTFPTGGNTSW